jgi:hypothetical protein
MTDKQRDKAIQKIYKDYQKRKAQKRVKLRILFKDESSKKKNNLWQILISLYPGNFLKTVRVF